MKKVFFLLLICLINANSYGKEKILVSYFKPFGGRSVNHTKDVAKELKNSSKLKDRDVEIILCPITEGNGMDVSFSSTAQKLKGKTNSFEQLKQCLKNNPDVKSIYSLGEGGCNIEYETTAYNVMLSSGLDSMKDHNNNFIPVRRRIENNSNTSVTIRGNDPNENLEAYCYAKLANDKSFTELAVLGSNPGTYVCNNLAYTMSRYLQEKKMNIGYEFIHIPLHASRLDDEFCDDPAIDKITKNKNTTKLKDEAFTSYISDNIADFVLSKKFARERKADLIGAKLKTCPPSAAQKALIMNNFLDSTPRELVTKCVKDEKEGLAPRIKRAADRVKTL